MGREATITIEQVNAAADAMKAEGIKPTSRAIRERLGNTGSMGTINKLLQRWKSGQEREQTAALVLPPALQRSILDYMDTELAAARATLEADLAEQQQEAADLAAEAERQAEAIEEGREQLEHLAAGKAAAEGKAGQLAADLAGAKEEAARERQATEQARTDLAKAMLRLEAMPRLEADLAAIRAELATERQGRIEAEQKAAVLASQKADREGRLVDAKKEAERVAEQLAKTQARAEQLADNLADARVTIQTAQARIEDLTVEIAKKDMATAKKAPARRRKEGGTAAKGAHDEL